MKLIRTSIMMILTIICGLILFSSVSSEEPTTIVSVNPQIINVEPQENFTINISCIPSETIEGFEFDIIFDANVLKANSVQEGTIFNNYSNWFNAGTIDNQKGYIDNVYSLITGTGNTSQTGTLAKISFSAFSTNATTIIELNDTGIANDEGYISINIQNGQVNIGNPDEPIEDNDDASDSNGSPSGSSNSPPSLPERPEGKQNCLINRTYTFSTSAIDSENDDIYYTFDWDDNSKSKNIGPFLSGINCTASHQWNSTGIYNITVQAIDVHGKKSDWSPKLTIFVQNQSLNNSQNEQEMNIPVPSFTFTPSNPKVNESIQFTDTSIDVDGSIINWLWDFGDNATSQMQHPIHHYESENKYKVTLTIWDDTNLMNSTSMQIDIKSNEETSVQNETPFISFGLILILITLLSIIMIYVGKFANK